MSFRSIPRPRRPVSPRTLAIRRDLQREADREATFQREVAAPALGIEGEEVEEEAEEAKDE